MKIEIDSNAKTISIIHLEEGELLDAENIGGLLRHLSDILLEPLQLTITDEDAELIRNGGWEDE